MAALAGEALSERADQRWEVHALALPDPREALL